MRSLHNYSDSFLRLPPAINMTASITKKEALCLPHLHENTQNQTDKEKIVKPDEKKQLCPHTFSTNFAQLFFFSILLSLLFLYNSLISHPVLLYMRYCFSKLIICPFFFFFQFFVKYFIFFPHFYLTHIISFFCKFYQFILINQETSNFLTILESFNRITCLYWK